jgi:DNA-directed RNA polymerase subunit M/transcription elongation factor TFIIS
MADAYINHGRWVIDCPNCNGGVLANAEEVTCRDCGHTYKVKFPEDKEQAEQVMSHRSVVNQNWHPDTETLADLKAENALRGLKF